ncbi:unnamed protein product [Phytophthora fragariaefolia]|uniref:Unnamed protein product n=1 Tax=Phytophthora fragariaefolia TaxID=1490495 RepID=A0A9W7CY31_9STRA|nr:unnamed protein product [Phytophthora fragariaefolia]
MFRKEARQEAAEQGDPVQQDTSAVTSSDSESNPMRDAAKRRRQEMAPEPLDAAENEAPRGSGLGFGSGLGLESRPGSGLGFRPSSGSGSGLGADEPKDAAASRAAKAKTFGWEKHTTGFGTKMLAKMGFKGRLGKKEDGVSATIAVKMRPAQMGIGFGDFVEASNLKQNRKLQKELKGENVEDEEGAGSGVAAVEDDTLWRKRKVLAGRRKHKRAAELAQEAQKRHKRSDVVLDMRGPSVRVLSGVAAAYDVDPQRVEAAKPKLGDELIYNVRMVVNMAEGKIYDLTHKIDANTESVAAMKKEAKMIKAQLNIDDVRLQHIQAMVRKMKELDKLREQALEMKSVEPVLSHLRSVRSSYPLEFDAQKLQQLVPSICMPPLRALLMESSLLEPKSRAGVVHQFRLVQAFLTELPSKRAATDADTTSVLPVIREKTLADGDDLYNYVLEETLWPAVVQCVNVDWQPKIAPSDCVDAFLALRPRLSHLFEEAFLDQLVLSRLKKECNLWNPRSDTISIHEWLLPWLPYIGSTIKSLYPDIRLALASALNQWHPSDLSVLAVLSPWRELWGEREYGKFTHRHIVRKLIRCLHREFEINPENQSLDALRWVLAWKDHLPHRQFIALLEGEFFPKWIKVLRKWVSGSPSLVELEKWYTGWKLLFEKNKLAANERLLVYFHGALMLMQVAAASVGLPSERRPPVPELNSRAPMNYQDALAFAQDDEVKESPSPEVKTSPRSVSRAVSLKDVIENLAITHNVTFMPKGFHDGQQVYAFGKHQIIIEQGVVFMEESKGSFKPVDLEQLL